DPPRRPRGGHRGALAGGRYRRGVSDSPAAAVAGRLRLTAAAAFAANVASAGTPKGCVAAPKPKLGARSEPKPKRLLSPAHKYYVTMQTNCGTFTFRVDRHDSPHVAASF